MLRIGHRGAKVYEPEEVVEQVRKEVNSVAGDKLDILMRYANMKP